MTSLWRFSRPAGVENAVFYLILRVTSNSNSAFTTYNFTDVFGISFPSQSYPVLKTMTVVEFFEVCL